MIPGRPPIFRTARRLAGAIILGLAAAASLAPSRAAGPDAAGSPAPRRGGTLILGVIAEPDSYDCAANASPAALETLTPHYSTLLRIDPANYPAIAGDLAQSWTVSPDRLTYVFRLRPEIRFHDGSRLTSADVKASYARLLAPPAGIVLARRANYAAIGRIETPDPATVVFRLKWPEAAMLANFAAPWTCIYSAAKLAQDPAYPAAHILGTGPFVFVGHQPGVAWTGKRWTGYFEPGRPFLDGFVVKFRREDALVEAMLHHRIDADFDSVTPEERDRLVAALGAGLSVGEDGWLASLLITFNTKRQPFDDARVRRALSLALDRWQAADALARTSYLKFAGAIMRPGSPLAMPEADLEALPGFSHDGTGALAEARHLLAQAGVRTLAIHLASRDIEQPYGPAIRYLARSWAQLGITVVDQRLAAGAWQDALSHGRFDAALTFAGDETDDPSQQLAPFVSSDLSPLDRSGASDRMLDSLFIGQAVARSLGERTRIVREFEQRAITEAYSVPLLWANRIVVTSAAVKGWTMAPNGPLGLDLSGIWLAGHGTPAQEAQQ